MLHYVALTTRLVTLPNLLSSAADSGQLVELAKELVPQWNGLTTGFHRITLEQGRVLLTLCVGDLTTMLREQYFVADSVFLNTDGGTVFPWDIRTIKTLTHCCRRGTSLASAVDAEVLRANLEQCGFEMVEHRTKPQIHSRSARFNPRWIIHNRRDPAMGRAAIIGTCAIVGAGLAGASVAAALALRGWQVQVLDEAKAPAAGASGLPVGLVVPHVSLDDCTLSKLSRTGVHLMLQQTSKLLRKGQDWDASGTLERQLDSTAKLPDIWHNEAAWIKPAQLVRAWLAQAGITFHKNTKVVSVRQCGDGWELLNTAGQVVATADRIVFANAAGVLALLEGIRAAHPALGIDVRRLPAMHGVRGQLSWGFHRGLPNAGFPPYPVNGAGSVIPQIPNEDGNAWYVGSSYQSDDKAALSDEENHATNLERLSKLLPPLGQTLSQRFGTGPIYAWKNTRCVTADHLPLVGPLTLAGQSGLWICAGMGSRGLSFSVLCAELLAASWGAEPLPVAASLAKSLRPLRNIRASDCL
jgi:tRNA 5-methylaminomethyl-2-thiouridine biosynthesis bifunctional protein